MPDFLLKCKAAALTKLKVIALESTKEKLWIQDAYYNIGSVLRNVNLSLLAILNLIRLFQTVTGLM